MTDDCKCKGVIGNLPPGAEAGDFAPDPHSLGGTVHSIDTIANLNSRISDATLDDSGDKRDPNDHLIDGAVHTTAETDTSKILSPNGVDGVIWIDKPFINNYIEDLGHQFLTTSTARILPGKCRDEANTYNIVSTSNLDANITVTGANGRNIDSAEASNKWYAFCIIAKSSDDTVASFLVNEDDWSTVYTLPTGYDKIRRIGWVRNNSSSDFFNYRVISFNIERHIKWEENYTTTQVLTAGSNTTFVDVDCSHLVPPDNIIADLNFWQDGAAVGDSYFTLRVKGSAQANPAMRLWSSSVKTNGTTVFQEVDSDRILQYRTSNSGTNNYIHVIGYIDFV